MRNSHLVEETEALNLARPAKVASFQTSQQPLRANVLLLSGVTLIVISASMMLGALAG
ncbi:hypothetical protein GWI72_10885 [Microvirga tunisiensis]|uniref:Uncharacterized protein n=2 Tax=Pannonibacter tanglangensis TaxID=2750084 RepID=A0A7X5F2V9_9HYPH|nr:MULTISPECIES: hypothetical protein [unclassified Pannonibacter]NBN64239.1 hypothetical protein [Pannonibacter sp. XCT-34]NBN78772.1 hypothetical protein [Pannonibacter sp. XCT-53]